MNTLLFTKKIPPVPTSMPNVGMLVAGESSPALTSGLSNSIGDTSSNNLAFTATGGPSVGTFSPYGSNWGMYFNGSSYLKYTTNSNMSFGTNDFTIELWFFMTSPQGTGTQTTMLFDTRSSSNSNAIGLAFNVLGSNSGVLGVCNGGTALSQGGIPAVGVWNHVAVCRHGGTTTTYLNGSSVASFADSNNYSASATTLIGVHNNLSADLFTGTISNIRVVNGTALYTSGFVPKNGPLTSVTNTVLLVNGNNFNDLSSKLSAVAPSGSPAISRFNPFSTGNQTAYTPNTTGTSIWFNNSGTTATQALTNSSFGSAFNFGTGDFTVEYWQYSQSSGSEMQIWTPQGTQAPRITINSGSLSFTINGTTPSTVLNGTTPGTYAWHHVAVVRHSGTTVIYVDGVSSASTADSNNYSASGTFSIGAQPNLSWQYYGYLSDLRVVNGTAVYTGSFTPPAAPLTAITGTTLLMGSQTTSKNWCEVYDAAGEVNYAIYGTAAISSTQSKINGTALYFNGSSNINVPAASSQYFLNPNTSNFTAEAWIYPTSLANNPQIMGYNQYGTSCTWVLSLSNGKLQCVLNTSNSFLSSVAVSVNTWTHVAVVKNGSTITFYVNGVAAGAYTYSTAIGAAGNNFSIGGDSSNNSAAYFTGYMNDVRYTMTAIYNGTFSPPTNSLVGK